MQPSQEGVELISTDPVEQGLPNSVSVSCAYAGGISCEGTTLAAKLGNERLCKLAASFYRRLIGHSSTAPYFTNLSYEGLQAKKCGMALFLAGKYEGNLRKVHLPLQVKQNLRTRHFDMACKLFEAACAELNLDDTERELAYSVFETARVAFVLPTPEEIYKSKPMIQRVGDERLQAILDKLHAKLHGDAEFQLALEDREHGQVTCQLGNLLGVDVHPSAKDIRAIHLPLLQSFGFNEHHFDKFCMHLQATCEELVIPQEDAQDLMQVVAAERSSFKPFAPNEPCSAYTRLGGQAFVEQVGAKLQDSISLDERLQKLYLVLRKCGVTSKGSNVSGSGTSATRAKTSLSPCSMVTILHCVLNTGLGDFKVANLREVHSHCVKYQGLTEEHFDVLATHLQRTLSKMGVAKCMAKYVVDAFQELRPCFAPFVRERTGPCFKELLYSKVPPQDLGQLAPPSDVANWTVANLECSINNAAGSSQSSHSSLGANMIVDRSANSAIRTPKGMLRSSASRRRSSFLVAMEDKSVHNSNLMFDSLAAHKSKQACLSDPMEYKIAESTMDAYSGGLTGRSHSATAAFTRAWSTRGLQGREKPQPHTKTRHASMLGLQPTPPSEDLLVKPRRTPIVSTSLATLSGAQAPLAAEYVEELDNLRIYATESVLFTSDIGPPELAKTQDIATHNYNGNRRNSKLDLLSQPGRGCALKQSTSDQDLHEMCNNGVPSRVQSITVGRASGGLGSMEVGAGGAAPRRSEMVDCSGDYSTNSYYIRRATSGVGKAELSKSELSDKGDNGELKATKSKIVNVSPRHICATC